MQLFNKIFRPSAEKEFEKAIKNILGIKPKKLMLYQMALSHRSIQDSPSENNERLEYLGDAVLSSVVADYLFKRYPYKGEGFLTEMRSKMVNRQRLNEVALKMKLKSITRYNKFDTSLKNSQIFGNTLEAIVGAVYLDKGYKKTKTWVCNQILIPHMFVEDLELVDINLKNKIIGWSNKNSKTLLFDLADEKLENGRRIFTMHVVIDGEFVSEGKGFTKKDASHIAAQLAIEKLGI